MKKLIASIMVGITACLGMDFNSRASSSYTQQTIEIAINSAVDAQDSTLREMFSIPAEAIIDTIYYYVDATADVNAPPQLVQAQAVGECILIGVFIVVVVGFWVFVIYVVYKVCTTGSDPNPRSITNWSGPMIN